ncbi:ABC-2 family transporter protein [Acutalibacter muris]|nr:ABC-2 family transporter protein [Acutalibacter muris]ANU55433.1 hypothetical protein A4V00_16235 [Hungateiclostridiaceae bacterium KB18]QQR30597.1 ABC-2 family transporter protein [Acutalibacter muris]
MQEIKSGLKMYGALLKMTLRGILQYRVDFWMSLVSVCLLNGANIVQLSVISWRFHALGSWQVGDLLVLYGLFLISWSIFSVFFFKLSKIEDEIVSGSFDVYLLRPVSPFLQLVGGDIKYTGLCDTLLGVVLVPMGLAMNGTHWGLWQILWFVVFVLSGGAIAVCIKFLISCATFWTTKANALNQVFIQIYLLTQKYPVTIFGPAFRVLVTGLVPVAYLNFYPAVFLLGKSDAPFWMCTLSPVVALVLAGISALVWRRGLRRYNSCGG